MLALLVAWPGIGAPPGRGTVLAAEPEGASGEPEAPREAEAEPPGEGPPEGETERGAAGEETETDPSLAPGEPAEPGREAPSEIEEITVTGKQLEITDVQDEAEAITAFDMEDLDRSNVINVEKLAFNVPGLHVGQQGNIGTENASITGETGVGYLVDGVYYARPESAQVSFFDLEGVQVRRGPQGTTGGKNTTGGWINVVTRKPARTTRCAPAPA
jgi:outer membrane receptor protein involved in Fe transport